MYLPFFIVPNPLDPSQPHLIEDYAQSSSAVVDDDWRPPIRSTCTHASMSPVFILTPRATSVPNPLADYNLAISSDVGVVISKPRMKRLELTPTRNIKNTESKRIRKKARHDNLVEIKKKYILLQEIELLNLCRLRSLIDFVEHRDVNCIFSSKLYELASEHILHPVVFVLQDTVALAVSDSGSVQVTFQGFELDSSYPKTLKGMICVEFASKASDILDVSIFWSTQSSANLTITPSVSSAHME